ncbi:hypothetical protein CMT89_17865 [Elizabethkingia anophelis]|nr:hypothetical protein IW22_13820 [Chryseobacterium sp. JM1]MDV3822372.1 hypothetical protein [Elizabethkingia anophelis]MDV3903052.1 hypothetical protein [Elizabethkingia anophelis]MDV3904614.1 hypothetical protein [Elizabethkingia anophelis]MDV4057277.1 hypothetical protein [Elizabethkingia anophelis]
MFTMQNSQRWQCLSANPRQLVRRFFENFYNYEKPLFNKGFGAFKIFLNGVLLTFANWHLWANKRAVQKMFCS